MAAASCSRSVWTKSLAGCFYFYYIWNGISTTEKRPGGFLLVNRFNFFPYIHIPSPLYEFSKYYQHRGAGRLPHAALLLHSFHLAFSIFSIFYTVAPVPTLSSHDRKEVEPLLTTDLHYSRPVAIIVKESFNKSIFRISKMYMIDKTNPPFREPL